MKVMTIVGTRPEIIRLSCVMKRLDQVVDHRIVHTGQNYDYELNEVFFEELGVRRPDHFLAVDTSSLGTMLGGVLVASERVMLEERPDAVLILGDTNSALAGVMARRLRIPLFHMEAGNRCFDLNVPEETNRRILDHISDFNLVYTEHARRHLISEGLPHRRIYLTGSPMREVLEEHQDAIESSDVLARLRLSKSGFFVVSLHREENVDTPQRLESLLAGLEGLVGKYGLPVVFSTHPRTRKRIEGRCGPPISPLIRFEKPFGFFDYVHLEKHAKCVISDSGTVAEESAILGFPAITTRDAIERPEAMDAGTIIVAGVTPDGLLRGVATRLALAAAGGTPSLPVDYQVRDTSSRVVALITGTASLSHGWDGIREDNMGRDG